MTSSFLRKIFNQGRGQRAVVFAFRCYRTTATSFDNVADESLLQNNATSEKRNKPKRELNITENSPSWVHQLSTQGYAVVPNVLTALECDHIIGRAWDWLSTLGTGIRRDDQTTWTNDRWPKNFNGIIQRYRIGHAPFVWQARMNPNVVSVFENIWGTNELLTSFDAMCILRPTEIVDNLEYTPSWFHTDQSPKKQGLHCVQGILNLEEASVKDAGFACYPGSHLLHKELFQRGGDYDTTVDFNVISEEDLQWVKRDKGLVPTRVSAPKGGFLVFDSRLVHCNVPAEVDRDKPRWRYTLYICMTPRAWADNNTLQARVKAFRNQRMTTHWPHHVGLFPDDPDFPLIPEIELGDIGEKLVGLKDYDGNELVLEEVVVANSDSSPHERPAL